MLYNNMMTHEAITPEQGPTELEPDWRDELIESYAAQGLVIIAILPSPPERPTARQLAYSGDTHGFRTRELPWASPEDEAKAVAYAARIEEFAAHYDDVRIAHPTQAMILENPEYAFWPHNVVMGSPVSETVSEP
jgi:hypothetical protein